MTVKKKKQTAVKGRSPALIITIVAHVVLFLVAGTFVAMEVVERQETKFEGKQIVRPKMKLKRLQVPVKIEEQMKQQTPKPSQRLTDVSEKTANTDFKMPEISGLGRGIRADLSGASLGGSLGFATTQINIFGLKSSGEKILFVLDAGSGMLVDELGGILAYKIIKDEMAGLIGRLPSTTLFNVIVFDGCWGEAQTFSSELSSANDSNIQKLKTWLEPLNNSKEKFGIKTLGFVGVPISFEPMFPIPNRQFGWASALSYAVKKGVDNIYWLGERDDLNWIHKDIYEDAKAGKPLLFPDGRHPSLGMDWEGYGGEEKWNKQVEAAQKKHDEENADRLAKGKPVRVIRDNHPVIMVRTYFPAARLPQAKSSKWILHSYTARDVVGYIEAMQNKYGKKDRRAIDIGLKDKRLSFNVIQFVPKLSGRMLLCLDEVAHQMNGDYIKIQGLEAIQSAATQGGASAP